MADDKTKTSQDRITTDPRPRLGHEDTMPTRREAPATAPASKAAPKLKKAPVDTVKDNWREIVETVVFVVVLVLLLKSFAAEAFVIPTGSMAETLYGYQKWVACPQCDFQFPVNCSSEVEEESHPKVDRCVCPNCMYKIDFKDEHIDPSCNSGDRVLVAKHLSETHLKDFKRFDVVVFKFPEEPQHDFVPMNYIKRLIGLPGETIGIYHGDLYVATGIAYPKEPPAEEAKLPRRRQMYRNEALRLLENPPSEGVEPRFHILRKPPAKVLAMRRIVYDNNHPARDLVKENFPPRWAAEMDQPFAADFRKKREQVAAEGAWIADSANGFQHPAREGAGIDWLRYRHLLRVSNAFQGNPEPEKITDFIGYNGPERQDRNWVGDLILDFTIEVKENKGDLIVELSKGEDRFQARWQLATGFCTLVRHKKDGKDEELKKEQTSLKKPGTYKVRFANVDEGLIVWVDGNLPFGDPVSYKPPADRKDEDNNPNNLEPASIGVRGGGVQVRDLVLWRDTYYTEKTTLYVRPGHYLCLGDNSPQSSDSRSWGPKGDSHDKNGGLVPAELMLGRALLVYWPFTRAGTIR